MIGGATGSPGQRKGRIYYYGCSYHQNRGTTVCANDHRVRIELIDAAVLKSIEQQVLTPGAVSYVIERAIQHIKEGQRRRTPDQRLELEAELRRLTRERDNLVRAIARGGLRRLLDGPIRFIPVKDNGRKTYHFEGQTKVGPLFDPTYIRMASPTGFEPVSPKEKSDS